MPQPGDRITKRGSAKISSQFKLFEPWDLLRGLDVFRDVRRLDQECQEAALVHFAPNCATFSRAREIPIKGVRNPPKPLRSEEEPTGIKSVLSTMSKRARVRLEKDTLMAGDSASRCLKRHKAQRSFSLEHPGRSIALPGASELEEPSSGRWCQGHPLPHLHVRRQSEA